MKYMWSRWHSEIFKRTPLSYIPKYRFNPVLTKFDSKHPSEALGIEGITWTGSLLEKFGTGSKPSRFFSRAKILWILTLCTIGVMGYYEFSSAKGQAALFHWVATHFSYAMRPGKNTDLHYPQAGPFDIRNGYTRLPGILSSLENQGFEIHAQARQSAWISSTMVIGLPAVYPEKNKVGLQILDRDGQSLFSAQTPERIFQNFQEIPDLIVQSLLFIENRELLDPCCPFANPAVEWDRFVNAMMLKGFHAFDDTVRSPGGSTLATQMEKFRHSPSGKTANGLEKIRQMAAASLQAYLAGENSLGTRKNIVRDYLNSFPMGSLPEKGEIFGLGDGLKAWYGLDLHLVCRQLQDLEDQRGATLYRNAATYKKALSLLLALRRPAYFIKHEIDLNQLTDTYLKALTKAGIISPKIRDAALGYPLTFHFPSNQKIADSFIDRKAPNAIRRQLQQLTGVESLFDLDHLDLTVETTIDRDLQEYATTLLRQLKNPDFVKTNHLFGHHLLDKGNPANVVFSLNLYERTPAGNLLRVQTDTLDNPLDMNRGTKMDLGSTAKLRTLVTYLEIIEQLHDQYGSLSEEELKSLRTNSFDPLSKWAVRYIRTATDPSLSSMLDSALTRRYSADPQERFLTGGGIHTFNNFTHADNKKVFTVREAFHHSVNLVFIRLMRDIVRYYIALNPTASVLEAKNPSDPLRKEYLVKFAKQEGQVFLRGFYQKYRGKNPEEAFATLLQGRRLTPARIAVIFRSIYPEAGVHTFCVKMQEVFPNKRMVSKNLENLYNKYGPEKFSLGDRGYVAHVHPLELWTIAFLNKYPQADWTEVTRASEQEIVNVYSWLFRTTRLAAQEKRIKFILEQEAFIAIHKSWKRLGYPFGALVPSYATAIGSSADRPASLAELMGILVNDGVKAPVIAIHHLHFAEGTPFEALVVPPTKPVELVLNPEIAWKMREALIGVVEEGTAQRAFDSIKDGDGFPVTVAGKTGTGDHRYKVFGQRHRIIESHVLNRTATFVFEIGEQYFGTITAQVAGPEAAEYQFTSSLPVTVFRLLAPEFSKHLYGYTT